MIQCHTDVFFTIIRIMRVKISVIVYKNDIFPIQTKYIELEWRIYASVN